MLSQRYRRAVYIKTCYLTKSTTNRYYYATKLKLNYRSNVKNEIPCTNFGNFIAAIFYTYLCALRMFTTGCRILT